MSCHPLRQGVFLLALLLAAGAAWAASFSVTPVRVTLSAAAPITALTVHNASDEAAVVQLHAMSWTQSEGSDHYEPTRELIATPPIFTLPPRGSQIVRIGLRRAVDPRRELTYRLYLQEVLAPPPADFVGTRVALRLGVPVFVPPAGAAPEALRCEALRGSDGALSVACQNDGQVHVRIRSLSLSPGGGGAPLHTQQIAADVHAGQKSTWVLRTEHSPAAGVALRLSAATARGDVHADLIAP